MHRVEVVMISQESTTLKLFGCDFRNHTEGNPCSRDSLWLSLLHGSSDFSLVLGTTSEKSFIPYKPSATVQAGGESSSQFRWFTIAKIEL